MGLKKKLSIEYFNTPVEWSYPGDRKSSKFINFRDQSPKIHKIWTKYNFIPSYNFCVNFNRGDEWKGNKSSKY